VRRRTRPATERRASRRAPSGTGGPCRRRRMHRAAHSTALAAGPPPAGTAPGWDASWRARLVQNLSMLVGQLRMFGVHEVFIDASFVENTAHPQRHRWILPMRARRPSIGTAAAEARSHRSSFGLDPGSVHTPHVSGVPRDGSFRRGTDTASSSLPTCRPWAPASRIGTGMSSASRPPFVAPPRRETARHPQDRARTRSMIRTDAEHRDAVSRLAAERARLADHRRRLRASGLSPREVNRVVDPMESFRRQLEEEVEAYERLRAGDFDELHDLVGLGPLLVGLRIACDVSQRDLAERLGVHESQVSRDERDENMTSQCSGLGTCSRRSTSRSSPRYECRDAHGERSPVGSGPLRGSSASDAHCHRKIRSATASVPTVHAASTASSGHWLASPAPSSITARRASFTAVSGRACSTGWTASGNRS